MFDWLFFWRKKPAPAKIAPYPLEGHVWFRTAREVGRTDCHPDYPAEMSSEEQPGWKCMLRVEFDALRRKLNYGQRPKD
jgi:hypothetical protein